VTSHIPRHPFFLSFFISSLPSVLPSFQSQNIEEEFAAARGDYTKYLHAKTAQDFQITTDDWYERHHPYDEIVEWMQALQEEHSDVLTFVDVGRSYENRTIHGLVLHAPEGKKGGMNSTAKPKMVIDGSIHGQEKIGSTSAQYAMDRLIREYAAGVVETVALVDATEVHFIPVFNVDGWEANTRKSRMPTSDPRCIGTDMNRNSPVGFGQQPGSSSDPCSGNFDGGAPFSNVEVLTMVSKEGK
jgi:murein tripeptide amidase MpaA